VMQSFGAGSIEVTAGAKRYNLRRGARARVTIPVDRSQLAAGTPLEPVIPFLFYDEGAGVWRHEGDATLVGKTYVADVSHLSYINADTLKIDQACVRILSPTLPANYNLEAWIPQSGGAQGEECALRQLASQRARDLQPAAQHQYHPHPYPAE
jgi:hypothetical protein